MGQDTRRDRWARVLQCAPWILSGRFADAAATLEADLAWDLATGEQNHRLTRRIWLGHLEFLMDSPARALLQAEALCSLAASAAYIEETRQGALLAHALDQPQLAAQALENLRKIEQRWPSPHSQGLRAHVEGVLSGGERGGALLNQALGLWPDSPVVYSRARRLRRWRTSKGGSINTGTGFRGWWCSDGSATPARWCACPVSRKRDAYTSESANCG
jgi:hypothetical protein